MANPRHVCVVLLSAAAFRQWRIDNPDIFLNLCGANLHGADLVQADLSGADLKGANLAFAHLNGADLSDADLAGATLVRSNLRGAQLLRTNLQRADLTEANLRGANLTDANLDRATVRKSVVRSTVFGNLDLSALEGLEQMIHQGPSYLDRSTLSKSRGRLPPQFLRGCGLSKQEIDGVAMPLTSFIPQPIALRCHAVAGRFP